MYHTLFIFILTFVIFLLFFSITIIPSHWKDKVYSRCCCVPLWTPLRKVHTQYAVPPRRPHSRCCPRHCTALQRLPPFFSILSVIFIFIFKITNCDLKRIVVILRTKVVLLAYKPLLHNPFFWKERKINSFIAVIVVLLT